MYHTPTAIPKHAAWLRLGIANFVVVVGYWSLVYRFVGIPWVIGIVFFILSYTLQWLVIRRCGVSLGLWLGISFISQLIAGLPDQPLRDTVGPLFHSLFPPPPGAFASHTEVFLKILLTSFVAGLILGCGQWLVLRKRLPQAGWWIVIMTLTQVAVAIADCLISIPRLGCIYCC